MEGGRMDGWMSGSTWSWWILEVELGLRWSAGFGNQPSHDHNLHQDGSPCTTNLGEVLVIIHYIVLKTDVVECILTNI